MSTDTQAAPPPTTVMPPPPIKAFDDFSSLVRDHLEYLRQKIEGEIWERRSVFGDYAARITEIGLLRKKIDEEIERRPKTEHFINSFSAEAKALRAKIEVEQQARINCFNEAKEMAKVAIKTADSKSDSLRHEAYVDRQRVDQLVATVKNLADRIDTISSQAEAFRSDLDELALQTASSYTMQTGVKASRLDIKAAADQYAPTHPEPGPSSVEQEQAVQIMSLEATVREMARMLAEASVGRVERNGRPR